MSLLTTTGSPVTGYASLSSTSLGPTQLQLFSTMGAGAYMLSPFEYLYITNVQISTNDATQRLVTLDTGGLTPTKLASLYATSSFPPIAQAFAPGTCRGLMGDAPWV